MWCKNWIQYKNICCGTRQDLIRPSTNCDGGINMIYYSGTVGKKKRFFVKQSIIFGLSIPILKSLLYVTQSA